MAALGIEWSGMRGKREREDRLRMEREYSRGME